MKIFINAGHGPKGVNNSSSNGYDPGAIGLTGYKESVETKEIADLVSNKLKFNGIETMVYQDGDLYDVTNKSNLWKRKKTIPKYGGVFYTSVLTCGKTISHRTDHSGDFAPIWN